MSHEHSPTYLCPECGYELNPSEGVELLTCPECGELVSRWRSDTSNFPKRRWVFLLQAAGMLVVTPAVISGLTLAAAVGLFSLREPNRLAAFTVLGLFLAFGFGMPILLIAMLVRITKMYRRVVPSRRSGWMVAGVVVFALLGVGIDVWATLLLYGATLFSIFHPSMWYPTAG